MTKSLLLAGLLSLASSLVHAVPILYVHDAAGRLGTVDVPTGNVTLIGVMGVQLTDIAFDPLGNMYGLSFTQLYRINPNTAALTLIGNHGILNGNALVFDVNGTLYGAGSSTNLYSINPTTAVSTNLGGIGFASAGDLAFNGGNLYLSSTTNQLIRIALSPTVSGTAVGAFGFSDVFGLATANNGVLYGLAGTNIFSVNTTTGAGTLISNYAGSSVGASFGSSFFTEAGANVAEGGHSLGLLAGALLALGLIRRRVPPA